MKKIDELKAEIKKAEKELESKKKELERIEKALNFKIGDYVQFQAFGRRFVGIVRSVLNEKNGYFAIEVRNGISKPTEIPSEALIEKWQPQRGDLCIFWDKNKLIKYSIISIFNGNSNGLFQTIGGVTWDNCIPFISEKQYKEHIGYEN